MPQRLVINSRVDHESFNFNINKGHGVIFASKNMRKDITQEDEHRMLSMLVLEQMSFFLAKKNVLSQTRMKHPFHHFMK